MKIAFVGASGYGNVGDDTYPLVFREHLPDHELIFFNSDLPEKIPEGIGLLIIGGGGVVHNAGLESGQVESPHFIAMRHYLAWARENRVPWGFLSCGIQFSAEADGGSFDTAELQVWAPWLRDAAFITMRSPFCARIASLLGARDDARFFPDAAYLLARGVTRAEAVPGTRQFTIVPAGSVHVRHAFIQHMIAPYDRAPGWRMVWLNMGAPVDAGDHFTAALSRYPGSTIVERPSPREALSCIAASDFVLTGRYHGMVFARACSVPFYVHTVAPSKIKHEDYTVDPALAIGHIDTVRECISRLTKAA